MSITAFPVLARHHPREGHRSDTRLGTLTLAAGASDDALAWCLLAVVLSQLEGTLATAVVTIVGAAAFRPACSRSDGASGAARRSPARGRSAWSPRSRAHALRLDDPCDRHPRSVRRVRRRRRHARAADLASSSRRTSRS
jgi:hypothetical protein